MFKVINDVSTVHSWEILDSKHKVAFVTTGVYLTLPSDNKIVFLDKRLAENLAMRIQDLVPIKESVVSAAISTICSNIKKSASMPTPKDFISIYYDKVYYFFYQLDSDSTVITFRASHPIDITFNLPLFVWLYIIEHFRVKPKCVTPNVGVWMSLPHDTSLHSDQVVDSILQFIKEFKVNTGHDFGLTMNGSYSYHFASILQSVFPGGKVCLVAPYHYCIFKYKDTAFDINGIYIGASSEYVDLTDAPTDIIANLTHNPLRRSDISSTYWDCRLFLEEFVSAETLLKYDSLYKRGEFDKVFH